MDQLLEENRILKQKNWSRSDRQRDTNYFLLIDSRTKPQDEAEEAYVRRILDEFMVYFRQELANVIQFNNTKKRQHFWSPEYIDDVSVRYVIEKGRGKFNKDGTKSKVGGTMHLHIVLRIKHHSNITLNQEPVYNLANTFLFERLGKKPFVAKPRLITADRVEEYMTKDLQFDGGVDWVPK